MSEKKTPSNQQNKTNQGKPEPDKKPDNKAAAANTPKPKAPESKKPEPKVEPAKTADAKAPANVSKAADAMTPESKASTVSKPDSKATPAGKPEVKAPESKKPEPKAEPAKTTDAKATPASKPNSMSSNANTPASNSKPPQRPSQSNSSGKGSALPLLFSVLALGVSGYALYLGMNRPADPAPTLAELKQNVQQLSDSQAQVASASDIERLQGEIKQAQQQQVSDDQIQNLIDQSIKSAAEQQQSAFSAQLAEQGKASVAGVSEAEVQAMIKSALSRLGDNAPEIDLSDEMAQIESYKQEIAQLAQNTQQQIEQQLDAAQTQISENRAQPLVYPLINSLSLANIAANSRQFDTAARYLEQAKASFAPLHLDQPPYGEFAPQISAMNEQFQQLASAPNPANEVGGLVEGLDEWPFKALSSENLLARNEPAPADDWSAKLRAVGSDILSSTVSISKNDAAGLDWVSNNPALQQIVRENVRLDLSMARNLLATGDIDGYQALAQTLSAQIERYFDTSTPAVENALSTLRAAGQHSAGDVPDVAGLINALQQAK